MKHNKANLNPERFSTHIDGKEIKLYTITNENGLEAHFINQGAKLVSLIVPSKDGFTDVVIGHDSIDEYINSEEQYFGAICGRYANRIANGKFSIDGQKYNLAINNGPNALHGGVNGFNVAIWNAEQEGDNKIVFSYTSKDGEEGYPGELKVQVSYTLTHRNELLINYKAKTTKPTVINLTNHSYFNLSGNGDKSVHDHMLQINAKEYLPTDETAIPYGKPESVIGTQFDFTIPHLIGERIDEDVDQLKWARGYDHTFILDKPYGKLGLAAVVSSDKTNIQMEVYTDQPGMQVYTGNWMSGNMRGKHDKIYPARAAVCFETQHFPDSPNKSEYPSTILRPKEEFNSTTVFAFSLK